MLDHQPSAEEVEGCRKLREKRILVVEDDAVVAVDCYFELRDIGAKPQAFEATNTAALNFLGTNSVDGAIIDYRLRDGTCEPVLACLERRHIPFVVVSGCTFQMHDNVNSAHVLSKPVTPTDIWRSLSELLH